MADGKMTEEKHMAMEYPQAVPVGTPVDASKPPAFVEMPPTQAYYQGDPYQQQYQQQGYAPQGYPQQYQQPQVVTMQDPNTRQANSRWCAHSEHVWGPARPTPLAWIVCLSGLLVLVPFCCSLFICTERQCQTCGLREEKSGC